VIAAGAALVYVVVFVLISQNGYGDNLDNYGMLRAWQEMVAHGTYLPSRFQGNLPSELALGYLASLGGPAASNTFSFLLSLLALLICYWFFLKRRVQFTKTVLAVLTIAFNPFWLNAASTSMDYVHAVAFFLLGCFCLAWRLPVIGALVLALATACRISYAPLGLAALAVSWHFAATRDERRVLLQSLAVFLSTCALLYLPVFIASHLSLSFLSSARPMEQGVAGLLARSLYKSIYLYGLLGTLVLLYALLQVLRPTPTAQVARADTQMRADRIFDFLCLGVIAYHALLFLYIPVRIEYLLPVLPACAALLLRPRVSHLVLWALLAAELSYWFVSLDLLRIQHRSQDPCAAVQAVGAVFDPHLGPGVLLPRLRHETDELRCLPAVLILKPGDIHDPLPRPPRAH
jgi:hypothetical protein